MIPHLSNMSVMDADNVVTLSELSFVCDLSVADLDELIDYGVLVPLGGAKSEPTFSAACVMPLRAACQQRQAFDLDLFTVAILVGYLDRIELLEKQVRSLSHCVMPAPLPN